MFGKVVLDVPLEKEFDYAVPAHFQNRIQPGMRVWVPFGPRRLPGYLIRLSEESQYPQAKEILSLIDKEPVLSPDLIQLARWMKEYYCCHLGHVLKSMLPGMVRKISPKRDETRYVKIIGSVDEANREVLNLERKAPKQALLLRMLTAQKSAIRVMDLARMAKTGPAAISALHKKGLVNIYSGRIDKDPYRLESFQPSLPHTLNEEQQQAYNTVRDKLEKRESGVILLQGITSSGKTEIYLQAIDFALQQGKSAIVIVPEIALTPQTVERFKSRFEQGVAVLHSRLSAGERYDQWLKVYHGQCRIVIGARSAVFAPVKNLGLIVIDEEHEHSYKQEDEPRYHAREVAVKRSEIEKAVVVLGSATPSLESYYQAQQGTYELVKLTKRIDDRPLAKVRIIDLKEEIKKFRRLLTFSHVLIAAIRNRLTEKQQVILFLNRRGFSPFIICRKCGFVLRCHHCSTALTYHQLGDRLMCHSCDYTQITPRDCPECHKPQIRFGGIGTQRVESQIARFFPSAVIRRMDTDVTSLKGIHKQIFDAFKARKIDILVGTQMIAKGLDFPNVTLVGVISADVALHLPDFRAGERTFQLLTQVAGRAGRGEVPGQVIIQTLTPEHPAIRAAATQNYDLFAQQELAIRKELDYPPYEHFINLTFRSRNPQKAELVAHRYRKMLEEKVSEPIRLFGPIPAPIQRLRGFYRWQLLVRAPEVKLMIPPIKDSFKQLGKPAGVISTIDVNPLDLL